LKTPKSNHSKLGTVYIYSLSGALYWSSVLFPEGNKVIYKLFSHFSYKLKVFLIPSSSYLTETTAKFAGR
jgi:hypothetical protein